MALSVTAPQGPEALRALLAEVGPRWHEDIRRYNEVVREAYAPLLAQAPEDGVQMLRGQAYGTHERQALDLFLPPPTAGRAPAPVVVFVHGGAYVRGERSLPGGMYDNVLRWFARQGFVGVNIGYRLAPEAIFPAAVDDLAAALRWVATHIAEHGGDASRVCLMAHSAGGTHAASYVFDPRLGHLGAHVRALVLVSARLRADQSPENPNAAGVRAYFGDDPSAYEGLSPMAHAACSDMPVFVVNAEFENPLLDLYGLEFAWRLAQARRRAPRVLALRGHNHLSVVAHFNTEEDTLGREILGFLDETWGPDCG